MRPPEWVRGMARRGPWILAGLAVASLGLFPFFGPSPVPAAPSAGPTPVESLRRGLQDLQAGHGDPLPVLAAALSRIRGPADLRDFDLSGLHAALRSAWDRERDPLRLARFAGLAEEIFRIRPDLPGVALERGDLWRRAGRPWEAARAWAEAARRVDPPASARILRSAAELLFQEEFFLPAARLYEELARRDPADTESLFRRAESLVRAGLWDPDALKAFDAFLTRVGPGDPLLPKALLTRGILLEELGRGAEALRDYERLLRDPGLGIDPRTEEWAEALWRRGRGLLLAAESAPPSRQGALRREARQVLEEYLERYAAEGPLGLRALEAAIGRVRVRLFENEWADALGGLDEVLKRLPSPVPEEVRGTVLEMRLLKGEILLLLGRAEEAVAAFEGAARRAGSDPARLGGWLGKARALRRLGRKEEARREMDRARAVYETEFPAEGLAREFWRGMFEAAAREVP